MIDRDPPELTVASPAASMQGPFVLLQFFDCHFNPLPGHGVEGWIDELRIIPNLLVDLDAFITHGSTLVGAEACSTLSHR
jgi:hypothetical protein